MTGPIVVLKFGGNALDASSLAEFATGVVTLAGAGYAPVVVHGGGPQIDAMLDRLDIPSAGRHQGLRITTPEAMSRAPLISVRPRRSSAAIPKSRVAWPG